MIDPARRIDAARSALPSGDLRYGHSRGVRERLMGSKYVNS